VTVAGAGLAGAVWRSGWTTFAVLAVYLLVLVRGLFVGLNEFDDPEHLSAAEIHLVRTMARRVTLRADAVRQSLRVDQRAGFVHGDSELDVSIDDFAHGAAVLSLEFNRAAPGDSLRVELDDGRTHLIDDLAWFRVQLVVPVRRGEQTVWFRASQPGLRYRVIDFALELREHPAEFRNAGRFLLLHDAPTHRTWLGSGWWWDEVYGSPLHNLEEALLTRRAAYLAIEPKQPGRWRVAIPYRWILESYPDPAWTLDGGPIVPRLHQDAQMMVASFTAELTSRFVVGLELRGPISSPRVHGISDDARTMAYRVWPGRITLEPGR
jgi:hypothetical protein